MTALVWLVTYLVHSTALCGIAAIFRRRLRTIAAAEAIWRAVVILPLVSATVGLLLGDDLWTVAMPGFVFSVDTASPSVVTALNSPGVPFLLGLVSVVGAGFVIRDVSAFVWFLRKLRPRVAAPPTVAEIVRDISRRGAVYRAVRVTQSASLASPVALGLEEICIPTRAIGELTAAQLRILLAHELAHLIRGDSVWFAAMALVESALAVQPLNRIARRELQQLAELACDDWAARQIEDPAAVAECLVEVLALSRRASPAMVPGAVGTFGLAERVTRLLGPKPPSIGPASRVWVLALSTAVSVLPVLPARVLESDMYRAGFEAGRREFADRRAQGFSPASRTPPSAADRQRRADLERTLQKRQQNTR